MSVGKTVAALAMMASFAGCVASPARHASLTAKSEGAAGLAPALPASGPTLEAVLAAPGLEALQRGDYEDAVTRLELALQGEPRSANLHLLLGVAYHQLSLVKSSSYRPLAETALQVAIKLDPGLALAERQLGRLDLENGRFADAEVRFVRTLTLHPNDQAAMFGLALAAYGALDYSTSAWAAAKLPDTEAETWRIKALLAAAYGDFDQSDIAASRFGALSKAVLRRSELDSSVAVWRTVHAGTDEPGAADAAAPRLMQVGDLQIETSSFGQPSSGPGGPPPSIAPPMSDAGAALSTSEGPMARDWSDCAQRREPSQGPNQAAGPMAPVNGSPTSATSAEDTVSLSALPSPCKGRPLPRMALIDAVIIRTIINGSSAQGVNLLDQLSVVLGANAERSRINTIGGAAAGLIKTMTTQGKISLPANGIQYSLNIANASGSRSEVLARPTLLALDREPSVFFSGSTLTVALPGQLAGGTLQQLPIGMNLSATPTFIDDDTLLVAVKASRSFFENTAGGTFGQAVQTSRNTVTANAIVRMGQTIVLSGLNERETQEASSAVPALGKIPGVQYLFKRGSDEDFRTELIILLTPRMVTADREASDPEADRSALSPQDRQALDAFRRRAVSAFKPIPNVEAIKYHIRTNQLYKALTGGRLQDDVWVGSSERLKFVNQLRALFYY